MKGLESAGFSLRIAIVAKRAPAMTNRAAQRRLDCGGELFHFIIAQLIGWLQWMNACLKERLIDVDISQPRDQPLIEQGILNCPRRAPKSIRELARLHFQRLGPHPAVAFVFAHPPNAAEAPRIAKSKLSL